MIIPNILYSHKLRTQQFSPERKKRGHMKYSSWHLSFTLNKTSSLNQIPVGSVLRVTNPEALLDFNLCWCLWPVAFTIMYQGYGCCINYRFICQSQTVSGKGQDLSSRYSVFCLYYELSTTMETVTLTYKYFKVDWNTIVLGQSYFKDIFSTCSIRTK